MMHLDQPREILFRKDEMVLVQVGCRGMQSGCPDSPGDAGEGSSEAQERSTLPLT